MKKCLVILFITVITHGYILAQETQNTRSWYVAADGSNENNGRSEDKAFKTLGKALSSANNGVVKKITVIGTIIDYTRFDGSNSNEILITGKDGSAELCEEIWIEGEASLRFENIVFGAVKDNNQRDHAGSILIDGKANVTLGKGVKFNGILEYYSNEEAIRLDGGSRVVMEADAEIASKIYKSGVKISNGTFLMKDNAKITNINGSGVYQVTSRRGGGSIDVIEFNFTMQNNTIISQCQTGLEISKQKYTVLLKDNALITDNTNRGVNMNIDLYSSWRTDGSSLTMEGKSAIKNNITEENGGGIYVNNGIVTMKESVEISGNKAKKGGGIYYVSSFEYGENVKQFDGGNWPTEKGITEYFSTNIKPYFVITGNVEIKNNTATEGGGIYVENGLVYESMTTAQVPTDNWVTNSRIKIASLKPLGYSLIMQGGTISGNKAEYGGGIYVEKAISIDERRLNENAVLGNGTPPSRSLSPSGKKFIAPAFLFSGGTITGNEAEFVGGGVYIKEDGAFSQVKGTVNGNRAGDGEGEDIYKQ
jgi:predicted outer membrane repeat protein